MILHPCNTVELTKIQYYDKSRCGVNLEISTISREVCENNFNKNVIIKRNIFGRKWVLKINESEDDVKKKNTWKVIVYILVFCSIIIAVGFGIFFSLDKHGKIQRTIPENGTQIDGSKTPENQTETDEPHKNDTLINSTAVTSKINHNTMCHDCLRSEVCLKIQETDIPKCVKSIDRNDPTGCGGLCRINTQYCQVLDVRHKVYQCLPLKNILRCPSDTFNCGNRCIGQTQRCDGVLNCSNYSDEEKCVCNLETHFHCGNETSCIQKSKRCDGKVDCWDKSDESGCSTDSYCLKDEIACINGECIQKDRFCDGFSDCADNSDEPEGCQI